MDAVGFIASRTVIGAPEVMPPENATGVVGLRRDAAVLHGEGIVVMAAAHGDTVKSSAEVYALAAGNAKERLGETILDAVEHRPAEPDGNSDGWRLNDRADAVAVTGSCQRSLPAWRRWRFRRGLGSALSHTFEGGGIHMHGVKGSATHICDLQKLGANINAAAVQDLFGDAASDAQRCCESAGKMTAAAHVGEAL